MNNEGRASLNPTDSIFRYGFRAGNCRIGGGPGRALVDRITNRKAAGRTKPKNRHSMPRYFFTIRGRDRVDDNPDCTYLPDVAAALSYAEYTIRELRKNSGRNDSALMMVVQDQARQTVLFLPFFPGS
jgi:hypothetical protein